MDTKNTNKIIAKTEVSISELTEKISEAELQERFARRLLVSGDIKDQELGLVQQALEQLRKSKTRQEKYLEFLKEVSEEV